MRTLRRPMFRGGSTGSGITSGLAPRQGYDNGKLVESAEERRKVLSELAGQRPDRSLSNFMIDFGLDIASRPPSGNIFQTAAASAREPFQRFQTATERRGAFDQQIGLTAAQSAIAHQDKMKEMALKGQTTGLIDAQKKAKILWNNRRTEANPNGSFNTDTGEDWTSYSEVEAFVTEKSIKSKSGEYTPNVERDIKIQGRIDDIVERDEVTQDYARDIAEVVQDALDGKFDNTEAEDKSNELSQRIDINQYYIVPDDVTKKDDSWVIKEDTNIGGEYGINKAYYNPQDNLWYLYDGKSTFIPLVLPGTGG